MLADWLKISGLCLCQHVLTGHNSNKSISNTCIIYSILNASVILKRNKTHVERNETRLERNEKCLERNDTRLALERNKTRAGNLHLSGTVGLHVCLCPAIPTNA